MKRFSRDEITPKRIAEAVARRTGDIPHSLAWRIPNQNNISNRANLDRYNNLHQNERCFIIGNGPSLNRTDLSRIRNECTFGLNRVYLLFEKAQFKTSYYAAVNELVLDQFAADINRLDMPKFLNWNRRHLFQQQDPNTMFVRLSLGLRDFFQTDPTHSLCGGATVTYVALQLAYFMGFKEVILIGVDHNFSDKGTPNTTDVRKAETDQNHFHPSYFPKNSRWQFPDLRRSEVAYELARNAFEKSGRKVLDATIGGKCQVFPKVEYSALF